MDFSWWLLNFIHLSETCSLRSQMHPPLIVGTVKGGGLDCLSIQNSTFQVFNKVPHWVDYITMEAEKHDEQVCISKLKL